MAAHKYHMTLANNRHTPLVNDTTLSDLRAIGEISSNRVAINGSDPATLHQAFASP